MQKCNEYENIKYIIYLLVRSLVQEHYTCKIVTQFSSMFLCLVVYSNHTSSIHHFQWFSIVNLNLEE